MQHVTHPRMSVWGRELCLGKPEGCSRGESRACTSFLDLPLTSAPPSCMHLQPQLIPNLFEQTVLMLALLCSGGRRSRATKNYHSHRMEEKWPWTPVLFTLCGVQTAWKVQGSYGLSENLNLIRKPHAISVGFRQPWSTSLLLQGQRASE